MLPRAWLEPDSYDFSFSGLKSAVLAALNQAKMKGEDLDPAHVARGFQESVLDVLVEKAARSVREFGAKQLLLAGGRGRQSGGFAPGWPTAAGNWTCPCWRRRSACARTMRR